MVKRRKLFQIPLEVKSLELEGVTLFRPRKFVDTRGYFIETFNAKSYAEAGVDTAFVQDNQSLSRKLGTIRGRRFQWPPAAQAKLVRCCAARSSTWLSICATVVEVTGDGAQRP